MTILTATGARNILNGLSKNPRTKNLNAMLHYLEDVMLTSNIPNHTLYEADANYSLSLQSKVEVILDNLLNHVIGKSEAVNLLTKLLKATDES